MKKITLLITIFLATAAPVSAYVSTFTLTTPTPSPSATPTPAPASGATGSIVHATVTPTPIPTPSAAVSPSVTPTVSVTPAPTQRPGSSPSVAPESEPVIAEGPAAGGQPGEPTTTSSGGGLRIASIMRRAANALTIVGVVIALGFVLLAGAAALSIGGISFMFSLLSDGGLLKIFGLRRRRKAWGVIYDARTKAPIPYAKVELLDGTSNRVLETRYADRQGRYGFLTSANSLHQESVSVALKPSAKGYDFPSRRVTEDPDFIVYDHVYFGGEIAIKKDALVNYNVPMDPVSARRAVNPQPLLSGLSVHMLDWAFWIGLIVAPLNVILAPTTGNVALLVLFVVANAVRISGNLYRRFGLTADAVSGKALPYALVTLNEPNGRRLSFAVSDDRGRYFLLTDPGSYSLITYTPAQIQPQRSASVTRTTMQGWIREKFRV